MPLELAWFQLSFRSSFKAVTSSVAEGIMVEAGTLNDKLNNVPDTEKPQGSWFHLGIFPFDPLFVWIALIYVLTR